MMVKAIRKGMLVFVKSSWRSARRHPLVVGFMLFILILFRCFPSLFALIVYSSPVIACTAILLGAILVYGEAAAPEAEDVVNSGNVSVKLGRVTGDVVKTSERFIPEMTLKSQGMSVTNDGPSITMHDNATSSAVSSSRNSDMEGHGLELIEKKVFSVEKQVGCPLQISQGLKLEIEKTAENQFESSLGSPWQQVNSHDISSASESDQEYSGSPSESMSDIIPIIDELHPLLESDNPQTSYRSIDTSDAVSRASSPDHESDDGSLEGEGGNQGDEEDEELQEENDNNESVVKWTADDQKNLMDLGSSELERNQRLENLIAKRRARKLQRFQTDKNLIDLDIEPLSLMEEFSKLNAQVPAISAPRHNPFEPPYDSEKSIGLPPAPGSAPSVLLPRMMNPFDAPYNLEEQSTGLDAESSIPYGASDSHKHPLQSGAAALPESSQENQEIKFKPLFVAEKASGPGFASFERQSSGKSDSKESSSSESDSNLSDANADQELSEEIHGSTLSVEIDSTEEVSSFDLEQELNAADTADERSSSSAISTPANLEVIDESYDGSGSSYCSEGIEKHHESSIHVEGGEPSSSIVEPGITTKTIDTQVADPVYDSSPGSKSVDLGPALDEALLSESKGKERPAYLQEGNNEHSDMNESSKPDTDTVSSSMPFDETHSQKNECNAAIN